MLKLGVFTSFKKRTDEAQCKQELKANSTFGRRDKSIPAFMINNFTTNIYTGIIIFTQSNKLIMFTHYLDDLCIGEGVNQRTVSLRLTVLVF